MLGITDWSAFWISFWSSLFAGAVDSLLIGFVVGVMILLFQKQIDKRRFSHKCEREVATFKEQLRCTLDQPNQTIVDNILVPSTLVKALTHLFSNSPIDLWYENTQKQKELFIILKGFQQAHTNFNTQAIKLHTATRTAIRHIHNSQGIVSINDDDMQTFFLGRILGFESKVVLPWVGIGLNEQALPSLEERHSLILQNTAIQDLISPYINARKELEQSLSNLRSVLSASLVLKQKRRFPFITRRPINAKVSQS
jgi:hypothetical protein